MIITSVYRDVGEFFELRGSVGSLGEQCPTDAESYIAFCRKHYLYLYTVKLRNNLRQVVYTYMPLSPSSITLYRPRGGDALRLGR